MLLWFQFLFGKFGILIYALYKYIVFFFFFIRFHINSPKSFKYIFGCRNRKTILPSRNLNRCSLIFCRVHSTCRKSFPDQLIQSKLIPCKGVFQSCWCSCNICRAYCFMCILNFLPVICLFCHRRYIVLSIILCNIFSCIRICFRGNSC